MQEEGSPGATPADPAPSASPLREALRRARVEAAEHSDVVIDLRHGEIARLEILKDAIAPVLADVPSEVDLFDVGLVPGDRPRLFIDMVSFVEMGRDRRTYRFVRDGRHGRAVAAESEQVEPIVDAVTAYVARRLIERERLLTDDDFLGQPHAREETARPAPPPNGAAPTATFEHAAGAPDAVPAPNRTRQQQFEMTTAGAPPRRGWLRWLAIVAAAGLGAGVGLIFLVLVMAAWAKGLLPSIG